MVIAAAVGMVIVARFHWEFGGAESNEGESKSKTLFYVPVKPVPMFISANRNRSVKFS